MVMLTEDEVGGEHHKGLIYCVIDLDGIVVVVAHHVLVVESAGRADEDCQKQADIVFAVGFPRQCFIMLFFGQGEEEDAAEGADDASPLPAVQAFAEYKHCPQKRPHGARSLHG